MQVLADKTVFLADDDEINNYLSRAVLEEFLPANKVFEFVSPSQVLQEAGKICPGRPDGAFLFFIDINMPEFNGWELISRLKALSCFDFSGKDSIYILSSSINPADQEKANRESAIRGFLEKPLSIKTVSDVFSRMEQTGNSVT